MLTKPIARTEVFFYRIIGYLGIVWPYLVILTIISAIITGFAGPGESLFRFRVWYLVGDLIRCNVGNSSLWDAILLLGRNVAIWDYSSNSFAAWELGMALLSMGVPESPIYSDFR